MKSTDEVMIGKNHVNPALILHLAQAEEVKRGGGVILTHMKSLYLANVILQNSYVQIIILGKPYYAKLIRSNHYTFFYISL